LPEELILMRYPRPAAIMLSSFLDTITCSALFGKKRWPGAPTELIDSRTVEEYLASGDFEETVADYEGALAQLHSHRAAVAAIANARERVAAAAGERSVATAAR
jgi:hypothetical protein